MSAATVEAPSAESEAEAAAALEAAASSGQLARAAGLEQGTIDGSWESLIGGSQPTERKIRLVGGAFEPDNMPDGGIQKGKIYHLVLEVRATGYAVDDTLDAETREPAGTRETKKLRATGGRFLTGPEMDALNAATE